MHPTLRAAALAVVGTAPALALGVATRAGRAADVLAGVDCWARRGSAAVDGRRRLRHALLVWERLHHGRVVIPAGAVAALALGGARAAWAVPTLLGAWAAALAAKGVVRRPRPAGARAPGSSSPSGHVAAGAAVACGLTLARAHVPWAQRVVGGLLAVDVVATATDRVLLRAHHLSDVVGGLALGAGFVLGSALGAGLPLHLSPAPKEQSHA